MRSTRRLLDPRPTLVATALAASTLLAGCSGDEPAPTSSGGVPAADPSTTAPRTDGPDATEEPTRPLAAPRAGRYPTYVSLGDSFTAAPLVGNTDRAAGCLRSSQNYPRLVAEALDAELTDVSCTGADTASLVGAQRVLDGSAPPQFEALREDTSLVTVGIGGNDFGIFSTLVGACVEARRADPEGAPCRDRLGRDGLAQLRRNIRTVGDRLVAVVEGIRDRSPQAEVVVVGYPEIVPADATCSDDLPIAEGDHAFAAEMNRLLADTQRRAASRADVHYLDMYAASDGHDVCSADPWVNGRVTRAGVALAFHPLAAEQEAVAGLVLDALARD